MQPKQPVEKETDDFVKACQTLLALVACEPLPTEDRAVIINSANELLTALKA